MPPHVKWCNTIAIYKNDFYRTASFSILKETYTIHPLFQPLYFMLYDTLSTVSITGRRKWGVLENPFFFQNEEGRTEKIELDNQVEKANGGQKKKNVYYSVPDSDIGIAERTVLEMKKNPIFKEKNEPIMKYLLFILKTDKFYYSKMMYQSSKMRNVDIPINYKISDVGFMTVEYVTPSLKTPIVIDLSSFKFAVGSDILNFTFVYWYLSNRYGNWVDAVFDFDYKLHIIDSELRMVELLPFNYLRLKENDYDICQIYSLLHL